MRKKLVILCLLGMVLALLFTCEMFTGDEGEGKLTISLGAASGRAAIGQPSLPALESIRVIITRGTTTVVDKTVNDSTGSYTFSLPAGSGYRVEVDAKVAEDIDPTPLARRYGGSANVTVSANTNSPVNVNLSVTETILVGIKNNQLYFFKDASVSSLYPYTADNADKSFGPVCFDRYGRLSIITRGLSSNSLEIWSSIPPEREVVSLESTVSSVSSVAYQDGFFYFIYKISSNYNVAKLDEAELGTGSEAVLSAGCIELPSINARWLEQYVPYQDWGYIGFIEEPTGYPKIIKVDGTGDAILFDDQEIDEIIDMKVINDNLYVLGKSSANKAVLYTYTTGDLDKKQETIVGDITGANIAGWGKDKVYVYYYNDSPASEGIMEVGVPLTMVE